MPDEAPVTRARRPSSRNEGVRGSCMINAFLASCGSILRQRRLPIEDIAPTIAADADVCLFCMADEALKDAEPRAVFPDHRGSLVGQHALIAVGFQELSHPEAAGITPRLLGREGMVGADH